MAAPITHLFLAQEFLDQHTIIGPAGDFFIGVTFPDIRYLGVIDRADTHSPQPTLAAVFGAPSAFAAGCEHHSLVDSIRNDLIREREAYSLAPPSSLVTNAFKFYEDEIVYDRITDHEALIDAFGDLPQAEQKYPIKLADLRRWHRAMIAYLSQPPSVASRHALMTVANFPEISRLEIERVITQLRNNETIADVIDELYADFTSHLQ